MTPLLPTEGLCHACYALGYAAGMYPPVGFGEWVARATRLPSGHSGTLDLATLAAGLLRLGIARDEGTGISVTDQFPDCSGGSSRLIRLGIARLILERTAPAWMLRGEWERDDSAARMPSEVAQALQWMGDDLPIILREIGKTSSSDRARTALGQVGERVVCDSERRSGRIVEQVSTLSDAYGYDIRSRGRAGDTERYLEVKCGLSSSMPHFYLSRNEFDTCRRYPDRWLLVQVRICARSFWGHDAISPDAVGEVRTLTPAALEPFVLRDSLHCEWCDSVRLLVPDAVWQAYPLRLDPSWTAANPLSTTQSG